MKTKEYITLFGLDKEEVKFSREEFLAALQLEFLERINITETACHRMGVIFTWEKFQNLVKEQQQKFNAISNKKAGLPLTEGLWGAFYATVIIPERANRFPEEHAKITAQWEARNKQVGEITT